MSSFSRDLYALLSCRVLVPLVSVALELMAADDVEVGKIVRPVPERGRARDRARELVQCPSARPVLVRVLCSTFEGV